MWMWLVTSKTHKEEEFKPVAIFPNAKLAYSSVELTNSALEIDSFDYGEYVEYTTPNKVYRVQFIPFFDRVDHF